MTLEEALKELKVDLIFSIEDENPDRIEVSTEAMLTLMKYAEKTK